MRHVSQKHLVKAKNNKNRRSFSLNLNTNTNGGITIKNEMKNYYSAEPLNTDGLSIINYDNLSLAKSEPPPPKYESIIIGHEMVKHNNSSIYFISSNNNNNSNIVDMDKSNQTASSTSTLSSKLISYLLDDFEK